MPDQPSSPKPQGPQSNPPSQSDAPAAAHESAANQPPSPATPNDDSSLETYAMQDDDAPTPIPESTSPIPELTSPSPVTAAPASPPAGGISPPAPYPRARIWLGFLLTVAVCLPPLLIDLRVPDVVSSRESMALLTSRETWQRQREGQNRAWLIPSTNGEQELREGPMTVWLNMLAWSGLDPATVDAATLAHRARLMAVLMGVIALASTYWAGMSIGGPRIARLSTVALGTTLLFIYQMRIASWDAHLSGFVALAMAAGLWAMRPLKPTAWVGRRISGWVIAGVALGAGILTKGPVTALLFVLPPLIAAIALTPRRRISNSIGLIFAAILGLIAAAPWYLYVQEQVPDAWERLLGTGRYATPRDLFMLSSSHVRVLLMLAPWQVWLIGALCQPFLRADADKRRQLLIAWFWFVLVFIAFSSLAAQHPRYLAPLLPAVALMVGQLWSFHTGLASQHQQDPGINLLRVPHWVLLAMLSVLGPAYIAAEPWLVQNGYLDTRELPGMDAIIAAQLAAALVVIAAIGAVLHFKWLPRLAAYATVIWMLVAASVVMRGHVRSEHHINPNKQSAVALVQTVAGNDLVYLYRGAMDRNLDRAFLFYAGRIVRSVVPDQLSNLAERPQPTYLIVTDDPHARELMQVHAFERVMDFDDGETARALYRSPTPVVATPVSGR